MVHQGWGRWIKLGFGYEVGKMDLVLVVPLLLLPHLLRLSSDSSNPRGFVLIPLDHGGD